MPFTVPNVASAAYPAQAGLDSGDLSVLAGGSALTGVPSGCAVTAQGTPNMTVAVASGRVRISGRQVAVTGGNVTITAADSTNPRHDLITVDTSGTLAVITGTPAAITTSSEPTFPAIPAGRVVLAAVYVPAASSVVQANQITDKRMTIPGVVWVINVCDEGAVGDWDPGPQTGTDSTAAFTNAVNKASALITSLTVSSVAIYVPPGQYLTEKIPPLPNRSALYGDSPGTTRLYRKGSGTTTGPFISNQATAHMVTIKGLTLDCRNVGDSTSHGISLDNTATGVGNEWTDGRNYCADLLIQYANGDGHRLAGRGVNMIERVQVMQANGHGFTTGTDSYYSDCDSGVSGLDGFYISGANTRITGSKAWYSGAVSTSGATGGTGHGFHFADGNYSPNAIACCEAQDNARAGFYLNNVGRQVITGCIADSNNFAGLNHAGFEVLGSYVNYINGFAFDRASNTNHQIAGLRVDANGGSNVIDVISDRNTMAQGAITTDSAVDTGGSRVSVGSAGFAANVGTYSGATMNFPTSRGDVFAGTLTQNTTIGLTTGQPGAQSKTFTLKQDATGGRTVTWPKPGSPTVAAPAVYWAGGTAPAMTTTANATDVYELVTADGIRWYGTRLIANAS